MELFINMIRHLERYGKRKINQAINGTKSLRTKNDVLNHRAQVTNEDYRPMLKKRDNELKKEEFIIMDSSILWSRDFIPVYFVVTLLSFCYSIIICKPIY